MAHGYLGDGYGSHGEIDPDRSDDRDRARNREHSDRGMIFGDSRDDAEHRRSFSAHPDDHYRSWRDRHMSELDRDYADYCREREQQFHREFDDWRRERHGNPQPLRAGMTDSGISHDPSGELQLETEASAPATVDPVGKAPLGTNAVSGAPTGRGRNRG